MASAQPSRQHLLPDLLRAAHIGPAFAVTALTMLLAVAASLPPLSAVLVTAAVATGQLTVGWANDLLDAGRDRQVARADKPLARGRLTARWVLTCLVGAAVLCVGLSCALGWRSAALHLGVCLVAAHAYNLGLKATAWSWAPYAVAFGALPAVVTLAQPPWSAREGVPPAPWLVLAAAMLGVAAHVLNALPDLADDAATGILGLPHRMGAGRSRVVAVVLLLGGSAVTVLGPPGRPPAWAAAVGMLTVVLGAVSLVAHHRTPFRAAIGIALVDVVLLVGMVR